MNGFLLDTNIPSELIRPRPDPNVLAWVAAQELGTLFLSAVSFGELRKGITLRAPDKRKQELELWLTHELPAQFSHSRILSGNQIHCRAMGRVRRGTAKARPATYRRGRPNRGDSASPRPDTRYAQRPGL